MKTFVTATALALLVATGAQAAGPSLSTGGAVRTVELTNAREIVEARATTISVTVGTPKEISVTSLPPRDRAEAGYKADAVITVSSFPAGPTAPHNAR